MWCEPAQVGGDRNIRFADGSIDFTQTIIPARNFFPEIYPGDGIVARLADLLIRSAMHLRPEDGHIPLSVLWQYSKEPKVDSLADGDRRHLGVCEDCVAVVYVCRTLPSLQDVEDRLKNS